MLLAKLSCENPCVSGFWMSIEEVIIHLHGCKVCQETAGRKVVTLQIIVILSAIFNIKDFSHSMLSKSRYAALLWALPTPQITLTVGWA